MRALLQRVSQARVTVGGSEVGQIGVGLLILLGVAKSDIAAHADFLVDKILNLRIFPDGTGKMNLSVLDIGGELLVVSQFTLYADCRKGRRPGFDSAAPAEQAHALYESFVACARRSGLRVETGVFQAHMNVALTNEGPVTLMLETESATLIPLSQ